MTPKEYLQKCRDLEINIGEAQNEYEVLYASMITAAQPKQDVVSYTPTKNIEDKYIELAERSQKVNQAIDDKVNYTLKVSKELDHMENDQLRRLLRDRYICCKSWEKIAVSMNWGIRHVYKKHGEALKAFEDLYPEKFTKNKEKQKI